ncbi:hypothetical protein [Bacillus sp. ISL-55]|nr:hypothetical protein [Bacillus sp. ISL-55]MBT2691386.1 hypothetical protein [Bacillus sp. ISL-55]
MKSLFDFIGRTETSRGARRCSWIKKSGGDCPTPTSAGGPDSEVVL